LLEAPVSVAYLQLQYLWLQWLQEYLVLLAAPVSVVPVAAVASMPLWILMTIKNEAL